MTAAPSLKKKSKKWVVRKSDRRRATEFAAQLGVSPIVADLLIARGYPDEQTARKFLNPTREHLHDPSLMRGMSEAVTRLQRAIDQQEPILIYGDYDVDG